MSMFLLCAGFRAVSMNVQIKNITNAHYSTPTQGAGILNGIPNRGCEGAVGFAWYF